MRDDMATQPEDIDIDLDPPAEDPENPVDPQDPENPDDPPEDEEEIVFGDDPTVPADDDSAVIRHLRAELKRRTQELAERPAPQPKPVEIGPKPTLETCEWDEEKFETELTAWHDRQRQAEAQRSDAEKQAEAANKAFATDVERFNTARTSLKVPGAPEAIDTALSSLSQVQQAALVTGADNAALVLAALGKHPGKLAELAGIANPIKFAVAVAKLEGTLKVQSRRKAPEPENVTTGNAGVRAEKTDKALERLEAEASRNGGDRSKIIAYKAGLKKAGKA
jgi:hypothetical protein